MRRLLLLEFWLPVVICLVLVVLYENECLLPGDLAGNKETEYYTAIVMELITICLIPLALRLFRFAKVRSDISAKGDNGLRVWASLRMALLTLPMMLNCWLYYQYLNTAFGYMGIIGLLSLAFVYPSRSRCEQELKI